MRATYMCVCVYVQVYVCVYIYIYIHTYIHITYIQACRPKSARMPHIAARVQASVTGSLGV